MATREEKRVAAGGGILAVLAGLVIFFWPRKGDPSPGPSPTPIPTDPTKVCGVDGQEYDAERYSSPAAVVADMVKLGYDIVSLTTSSGRNTVRLLQRRGQELKLRGMAGSSAAWVDGKMGPCTLRTLAHAIQLRDAARWPDPYKAVPLKAGL